MAALLRWKNCGPNATVTMRFARLVAGARRRLRLAAPARGFVLCRAITVAACAVLLVAGAVNEYARDD